MLLAQKIFSNNEIKDLQKSKLQNFSERESRSEDSIYLHKIISIEKADVRIYFRYIYKEDVSRERKEKELEIFFLTDNLSGEKIYDEIITRKYDFRNMATGVDKDFSTKKVKDLISERYLGKLEIFKRNSAGYIILNEPEGAYRSLKKHDPGYGIAAASTDREATSDFLGILR